MLRLNSKEMLSTLTGYGFRGPLTKTGEYYKVVSDKGRVVFVHLGRKSVTICDDDTPEGFTLSFSNVTLETHLNIWAL